jgi:hypothetical protein
VLQKFLIATTSVIGVAIIAIVVFIHRTVRWGATPEECSMRMPGDEYFTGDTPAFVAMTRAIDIDAPPETVWPWLAQLGRGAGFYSFDRLDNGGKKSARHIVSWIPEIQVGDATALGYVRRVISGRELTWWAPPAPFLGSRCRLAVDIRLSPQNAGSRLLIRMSGDAAGGMPHMVLAVFRFIDSVMARRQLLGIKHRVEQHGARTSNPYSPETGARDQYQLYEVVYATGERAGVPGKEAGEHWHRVAADVKLISHQNDGSEAQ